MESFKYALKSIPNVHFELLRQTSDMLCKIAANSEVNKMTVSVSFFFLFFSFISDRL